MDTYDPNCPCVRCAMTTMDIRDHLDERRGISDDSDD